MDPSHSEPDIRETDTISELPQDLSPRSHHVYSPNRLGTPLMRTPSHAQHVNLDFFDPSGVEELQRTLSRRSPISSVAEKKAVVSLASLERPYSDPIRCSLRCRLSARIDQADIKKRELGVVFEDLWVVGLGASATYQHTLGSMLNPLTYVQFIKQLRHPPVRDILSGFEGCICIFASRLTLRASVVLGRPGAGCSTLLKVLANQRTEYHAILCREEHRRIMIEVLMTIFGLRHVKDTLVGHASIRGVSGGEEKRVSISEVLAARSLLTSWDNSTRGLDASTAPEFVRALRLVTDIGRVSSIVSIYQAGESIYEVFDKVCVIYSGKMIYFGPADRARQYFIDMGYEPANRKTTADFLVAITDPNGRIVRNGYESRVPRTADEESEFGQMNRGYMASYREEVHSQPDRANRYKQSSKAERARTTSKKSPYIISIPTQARALMLGRVQIIKGAVAAQVVQLMSFILQGVIVGTIFLRISDSTTIFFSRGGVLFFALLFSALSTMAEIPALFGQRPIVLRHSKAAMYHPFVEALALTLVDLPISAVTAICFSIILYFVVRLQQTAAQFFIFLLIVSAAPAQAVAGLSTLVLTLYTGYTIPQPSMIGASRPPLKYGFEALMVNEFHTVSGECASLVPSGPGYENLEKSFIYFYDRLWRNFGIICGFGFGFGFIAILLMLTDVNTGLAGDSTVTLYKRGSKVNTLEQADSADEEKQGSRHSVSTQHGIDDVDTKQALNEAAAQSSTFSFQNLTYVVSVGGEQRTLLDNVSRYVAPGKLTALMGESDAGKTTLLKVLSEHMTGGVVTGNRFLNGQPLPDDFRSQTGYVQQMDTHLPYATVREALLFSAKLRQPASVPLAEKEAYVEKCLKMCGLEDHADAIVGSLSVEHRKRTTIGVELVAKPSLTFLDKLTFGLDAQSAWTVVCFLRQLADSGQKLHLVRL
ncbi:P-loop containing nucleoside triphosphate hydrolase protein [Laetiporus sulphureus 93-53]|uniref:p-loop containing nucleoside triphosphate hydrolase protein n=1 Tax=Laetiporus sulphureus 93-53 TaxID=1314785 RepID=A0A165ATE8_9APHY|nr:P-loop containing nucleoside triphosphate hydrolase protein [Laetiporus sulphureus 93-53]KZS99630.1 P-loop containing nucleoside triphosphate hydrolase protein [Laetiporus sulphureus 93-53]